MLEAKEEQAKSSGPRSAEDARVQRWTIKSSKSEEGTVTGVWGTDQRGQVKYHTHCFICGHCGL